MLICLVSVAEAESVTVTKDTTIKANEEYCALLKRTFDLITNIAKEKDRISSEHIETLRETELQLDKVHRTFNSQDAHFDDNIVLAQIHLKLSEVYDTADSKKERLYIAKEHLAQCVKWLKGKELNRKAIFTAVTAFYKLSCISMQLQDPEEMNLFMRKVLQFYRTYTKKEDDYPAPICILAAVTDVEFEINCTYEMDVLYARTLQRLLLYYYYHDDEYSLSMDKCTMIKCAHNILNKMLKTVPLSIKYTEWATLSSQLSLELLRCKRFNEARHHLAAAFFLTQKYYEEEYMKIDENQFPMKRATAFYEYAAATTDIALKWAKYGNTLLRLSTERLLHEKRDESAMDLAGQSPKLLFVNLEDDLQQLTALVTDTYITDYKDAKALFLRVLKWLEEAREYAANGKFAASYLDIGRGIFQAYKYFAYYEREKDDQIKLYKQRLVGLRDLSKLLNADDDINVRKGVWLQLVLASYSLLDIKTEHFVLHDKIDAQLSMDVDKLIKQNVHTSELYLHTTDQ